jgi:hypothetical protein
VIRDMLDEEVAKQISRSGESASPMLRCAR